MSGQGITNWRYQPNENKISANTVGRLTPAWVDTLAGDISSTPAVVDGVVYVTDLGGNATARNATTVVVIWQTCAAGASARPETVGSRTGPCVSGDSTGVA